MREMTCCHGGSRGFSKLLSHLLAVMRTHEVPCILSVVLRTSKCSNRCFSDSCHVRKVGGMKSFNVEFGSVLGIFREQC